LEKELTAAERDESIRYIVISAQEPLFPNSAHITDGAWYNGDNRVRAATLEENGQLRPEKKGMIEVRDQLARMFAKSSKVAAVFNSDEHNYSRALIDNRTPIGNLSRPDDDKDADQIICEADETCSPLSDLKHPVWYLIGGGAGAPYYAQQAAPWNVFWQNNAKDCPEANGCFAFSSQYNLFLLTADEEKISLEVLNPYGDQIDRVENLMAVKRSR
jgi:hypothetical protein